MVERWRRIRPTKSKRIRGTDNPGLKAWNLTIPNDTSLVDREYNAVRPQSGDERVVNPQRGFERSEADNEAEANEEASFYHPHEERRSYTPRILAMHVSRVRINPHRFAALAVKRQGDLFGYELSNSE